MKTTIIKEKEQARGAFNFGEILENKPIGFPQDGGKLKPYSNLFYWAHAWTPGGESTIGEHPHQGFEIMSFVLKGSIEHYDSHHEGWKRLNEGDAQIIRAGNGITHAERVNEQSEFFQIWVDPNLDYTIRKPASYDDYPSDSFPIEEKNGMKIKYYHGNNAPMTMDTKGVSIKEIWLEEGIHEIGTNSDSINSIYLIDGEIELNGNSMISKDFAILSDGDRIAINAKAKSRVFVIESPAVLDYMTYTERMKTYFR